VDKKILGPSFVEIAKKYAGQTAYLADKIKVGGSGVWGPIPMPAQTLNDSDANAIAVWLATGANR
jgi:cytochrome c551/c552